jgi:hypothetical protein
LRFEPVVFAGNAMRVYTVRKSEPNNEREFRAYINLLQEIGIDVAHAPRVPEPGTANRWLYVWRSKSQAQRFAMELGERLRQRDWGVHEFELRDESHESRGPLAPLTILSIPTGEGSEFRLESASQERIASHFPNANLAGKFTLTLPRDVRHDFERQHGPAWEQVVTVVTGLSDEDVESLGGVQIVGMDGRVHYQRMPASTQRQHVTS